MAKKRETFFLSLVLLSAQLVADPGAEIVASLSSQASWNHRPLSITFQDRQWWGHTEFPREYTNEVRVVFTEEGSFGTRRLVGELPLDVDPLFAVETRQFESVEVTAAIELYRPAPAGGSPVHAGEATLQKPDCNCTSRLLSMAATPMGVVKLIQGMESATWLPVATGDAESGWVLHGVSPGEPEGYRSEWEFAKVRSGWVPRTGRGVSGNDVWSTVVIETDEQAEEFRPIRVETTAFRNGEPVLRSIVSDFEIRELEKVERPLLMDLIPPGVIVSEYRYERPFAYVMGKRPPNATELAAMIKDDAAILAYQAATAVRPHLPDPRRGAPGWLLVVLAGVLVVPAAWYLVQRRRESRQTTG